jgi:hypothetical protein
MGGLIRFCTPARVKKQPGRRDPAGGWLNASMPMLKQGVAIRIEEVGGAQRAQIGSRNSATSLSW